MKTSKRPKRITVTPIDCAPDAHHDMLQKLYAPAHVPDVALVMITDGPRGSQPLTPADIISGLLMEIDLLLAKHAAEPHVRQHIEQLRRNSEAYLEECCYRKVGETWLPISTLKNSKED